MYGLVTSKIIAIPENPNSDDAFSLFRAKCSLPVHLRSPAITSSNACRWNFTLKPT